MHPDEASAVSATVGTSLVVRKKPGRPKGSGKGVSVRKVTGRVKLAKETTLALTHKLLAGSADKVVAEILRKALDPADRDQKEMLKLCFDRIAPITAFERANAAQLNRVEVVVTLAADTPTDSGVRPVEGSAMARPADVIDIEAKEVAPAPEAPTVATVEAL